MKSRIIITAMLFASLAQAKEPKVHQNGTLLQMDSAECGVDENSGESVVGELVGTDSAHNKDARPAVSGIPPTERDRNLPYSSSRRKHPALLPVGQKAQFRIQKDKMLLQVEDVDSKEREYSVSP